MKKCWEKGEIKLLDNIFRFFDIELNTELGHKTEEIVKKYSLNIANHDNFQICKPVDTPQQNKFQEKIYKAYMDIRKVNPVQLH